MDFMKFYLMGLMTLIVMISGCAAPTGTTNPLEQACTDSQGTVTTQMCCGLSDDFPNTCLIGSCGCSPDNSKEVKYCDCGDGRCFNGSACVANSGPGTEVFSFEECAAAGYPIMESYPRQCQAPDGQMFVELVANPMEKSCKDAGGNWNECSNKCFIDNQGKENVECRMACEALCECAGPLGFTCPDGYECKKPSGIDNALGYCDSQAIGGQRDEYGCLTPAGYSWDENATACIRPWELDENQKRAVNISVAPLSYRVTAISVETLNCTGCFIVHLERNDNQNRLEVEIENWTYKQSRNTMPAINDSVVDDQICVSESSGKAMELKEALSIASSSECTQNGTLTDRHVCNSGTGTWWIDLNLEQEGCSPACVVNIDSGTAEINWRCTGLLGPE